MASCKANIEGFLGAELKLILDAEGVTNLMVVGAMSHMRLDALARAASDLGYGVIVVHDAVTTRDLEFGGRTSPPPTSMRLSSWLLHLPMRLS